MLNTGGAANTYQVTPDADCLLYPNILMYELTWIVVNLTGKFEIKAHISQVEF